MAKKFIDANFIHNKVESLWYGEHTCDEYYNSGYDGAIGDVLDILDNIHAADVQEVRHGKWIDTEPKYNYENHCAAHYQCSECGRRTGIKQTRTYKYCPRCGARMVGDKNNN